MIVTRLQAMLQLPLGYFSLIYSLSSIFMDEQSGNNATWFVSKPRYRLHLTATTVKQGFGIQFGVAGSMMTDLTLSLYYLLMIKCAWKEAELKALERWESRAVSVIRLVGFAMLAGAAVCA